eukprot:6460254-Amphidinium_carterae.1
MSRLSIIRKCTNGTRDGEPLLHPSCPCVSGQDIENRAQRMSLEQPLCKIQPLHPDATNTARNQALLKLGKAAAKSMPRSTLPSCSTANSKQEVSKVRRARPAPRPGRKPHCFSCNAGLNLCDTFTATALASIFPR